MYICFSSKDKYDLNSFLTLLVTCINFLTFLQHILSLSSFISVLDMQVPNGSLPGIEPKLTTPRLALYDKLTLC